MKYIRVLLANHHPIVRNGLRCLLERDTRIRVIAEAANGHEAVALGQFRRPAVAILDVNLDAIRGMDAARLLSSRESGSQVIILGALTDESYVQQAFSSGARAYVLEDSVQTDLLPAVFAVAAGSLFLSPLVSGQLIDDWNCHRIPTNPDVAKREKRLVSLLVNGTPKSEISEVMSISEEQLDLECAAISNLLQRLGDLTSCHPERA